MRPSGSFQAAHGRWPPASGFSWSCLYPHIPWPVSSQEYLNPAESQGCMVPSFWKAGGSGLQDKKGRKEGSSPCNPGGRGSAGPVRAGCQELPYCVALLYLNARLSEKQEVCSRGICV